MPKFKATPEQWGQAESLHRYDMYLPLLLELKFRIEKLEDEKLNSTSNPINENTLEEIFHQNCSCVAATSLMNFEEFKQASIDLLRRCESYLNSTN